MNCTQIVDITKRHVTQVNQGSPSNPSLNVESVGQPAKLQLCGKHYSKIKRNGMNGKIWGGKLEERKRDERTVRLAGGGGEG